MPFEVPWTDRIGKPDFLEGFVGFHLGQLRDWSPEEWSLELGVWAGGEPAGFQGLRGERFAERRRIVTGSWLGARLQGRGYGTEMRAAALELAFAGLGATVAASGYLEGNGQSRRVSEKLGYLPAGEAWVEPRGVPRRQIVLELTRASWAATPRIRVEIAGLEPCLPAFGAA